MPGEVETLFKHIQMVLDRLGKGASLIVSNSTNANSNSDSTANKK